MNYRDSLTWLYRQLPMYQRQGKTAFKKDLTNILALSKHLNHPEQRFRSLHIAGTNGKGSVSHMTASVLQEADYKTGLYTSPHLKDFRERIRVNGVMIPKDFVTGFIEGHRCFLEQQKLSFFEMSVGMAFCYFAEQKVDIAIIETGLGGRLDSTNIIDPELCIITNIGFDHTKFLGDTLPEIAYEKAGIIKAHTPVVIGERHELTTPVFKEKAREMQAPLFFAEDGYYKPLLSDLKGSYQNKNIKTALTGLDVLRDAGWSIKETALKKGLRHVQKNTGLRGRWQELGQHPKIICDTGHNKEGLTYVMAQLGQEVYENLHIVLGVVNDKDLSRILPLFPKKAFYYFCKPNVPRGLEARELARLAKRYNLKGYNYTSTNQAYRAAKHAAKPEDLIFIGGSTFTVAEVL